MYSVNLSANNLREDYKFHHTFSTEVAKFLKVSQGKLVLMQPEKFQSKYEPRVHLMDIQVSERSAQERGPLGQASSCTCTASGLGNVGNFLCPQGVAYLSSGGSMVWGNRHC